MIDGGAQNSSLAFKPWRREGIFPPSSAAVRNSIPTTERVFPIFMRYDISGGVGLRSTRVIRLMSCEHAPRNGGEASVSTFLALVGGLCGVKLREYKATKTVPSAISKQQERIAGIADDYWCACLDSNEETRERW